MINKKIAYILIFSFSNSLKSFLPLSLNYFSILLELYTRGVQKVSFPSLAKKENTIYRLK